MSPDKTDPNIIVWIAGGLFGMLHALALFVLRGFERRITNVENRDCNIRFMPRAEFQTLLDEQRARFDRIEQGIERVHARLDAHFREDSK